MRNVKSMFIFGNIENYPGTSGLRRKDTQKEVKIFRPKLPLIFQWKFRKW